MPAPESRARNGPARLPLLAARNRARLAIVNREPTDLDEIATLLVHEGIGDTFGAAVEAV